MRITDPQWPAVREFSRRILREESIELHTPSEFEDDLIRLLRMMSEQLPARLEFPTFVLHEQNDITVRQQYGDEWKDIMQVGLGEPEIDVLWIALEPSKAWQTIWLTLTELLEAGYPGCLGCGGPASEEPWNEEKSRLQFRS